MKVTVISIGDELLIGQVINTLAASIARLLEPAGMSVDRVLTVGDTPGAITGAITDALAATDIVLTTGGLGPTRDDITKRVLCDLFGGTLVRDAATLDNINRLFARRGLEMNDLTRDQALVPSTCEVIQNTTGTAPVMLFNRDGKTVVAMPGVPSETITAMRESVIPRLLELHRPSVVTLHTNTIVAGFTESGLAEYIAAWEDSLPSPLHVAYLPRPGIVRLRLDAVGPDRATLEHELESATTALRALLGDHVIATDDLDPAEILINLCRARGLHLATAESCTGGNIARTLTAIAGCSDVVNGGVVAYSNDVKRALLGISADTLATCGAVSPETVSQMALGARRATGADVALATSGIAGPGGGTPDKPVGTVCIAVALPDERVVQSTYRFNGDRARVVDSATLRAILMAIDALRP